MIFSFHDPISIFLLYLSSGIRTTSNDDGLSSILSALHHTTISLSLKHGIITTSGCQSRKFMGFVFVEGQIKATKLVLKTR